ncbi:hypothetical protein GCM10008179_26250 [Hansschlegelia plantiphila]|uniref:3-deoxy-manno-octulosonate cytidylyltransferase n=1 Tax=Hansschlegelia plantiphila TaxID=374655 RepID=A0A9W6J1H3_9HYPH|nr:hypothetical protein GCM10008179_26250 [Hansschlegelia plantiphila]
MLRRIARPEPLAFPARAKALVMDFDGVFTDDRVLVDQDGREAVFASRSDGMGLDRLRDLTAIRTLILSKESNPVVSARARKLRIEVRQGVLNKLPELDRWLEENGLAREDAVYIGNDVNDLDCLRAVGFPVAPSDARPEALAAARQVTSAPGGRGALRELCEALIEAVSTTAAARSAIRPVVLIPARLGASRLPNKPLADIAGEPMITHVWRRASEAGVGPVIVATDSAEVAEAVARVGGRAELTRADHASGSDRISEALAAVDPDCDFNVVLNVQGDLPTIDPEAIRRSLTPLDDPEVEIATLVAEIRREEEKTAPSVVKMIGSEIDPGRFRCLYFTRAAAPWGPGPLHHHIGLYAYRRAALERFVALPPSPLERREKLEQLRAIEAGMRVDAVAVEVVPLGVDTPEDLARAREIMGQPLSAPGSADTASRRA